MEVNGGQTSPFAGSHQHRAGRPSPRSSPSHGHTLHEAGFCLDPGAAAARAERLRARGSGAGLQPRGSAGGRPCQGPAQAPRLSLPPPRWVCSLLVRVMGPDPPHERMRVLTHTRACTRAHTRVHTHMHARTHVHAHISAHTHTCYFLVLLDKQQGC